MKVIKFKGKDHQVMEELVAGLAEVVEMNMAVIDLLTLRIELLEEEVRRLQREREHVERD